MSNASAVDEEGVSQSNAACEDAESKCDSDVTAVRRRGKKRRVQRDSRSAATDSIGKLMSTYTDIVKQIAENRNTPQQRQEDKDWIFAELIYQTRKPRKGAAVIAASTHGFASCRKFKSPVTLTLDRVKVISTYAVHVGLPAYPTM